MSSTVRIERGVAVEMRDGVRLATDVYLPEGPGPFPTLVTRIRGGRSSGFIVGVLLLNPLEAVDRGYAVVVQEVRGRAGSEAAWHPFVHELDDGEDCLELGAGAAVVRRQDRHVRHRLLGLDRAVPRRLGPRRGEGARRARHRRRHPRRLGLHERRLRARLERLLGLHDGGRDDQATRRRRGDEAGAAARVRAGDHRGARRSPRGCRSPTTLSSTASARRSTASGSTTPTTTSTGRRSTSSR